MSSPQVCLLRWPTRYGACMHAQDACTVYYLRGKRDKEPAQWCGIGCDAGCHCLAQARQQPRHLVDALQKLQQRRPAWTGHTLCMSTRRRPPGPCSTTCAGMHGPCEWGSHVQNPQRRGHHSTAQLKRMVRPSVRPDVVAPRTAAQRNAPTCRCPGRACRRPAPPGRA